MNDPVNFWDWLGLHTGGYGGPGGDPESNEMANGDETEGTRDTTESEKDYYDKIAKDIGETKIKNNPELSLLRCVIRAYGKVMELDDMMSHLRLAATLKDLLDPGIRTGLLDEGLDFAEAAQLSRIGQQENACKDANKK